MPKATRVCGANAEMSMPRTSTCPLVAGKRPQMRLTMVLLPEPLGPIRPQISPCATARSTPSTARTPPKCLLSALSSSTGLFLTAADQSFETSDCASVEQATRSHVHGQDNQATKQQVAPIDQEL